MTTGRRIGSIGGAPVSSRYPTAFRVVFRSRRQSDGSLRSRFRQLPPTALWRRSHESFASVKQYFCRFLSSPFCFLASRGVDAFLSARFCFLAGGVAATATTNR